MIRHLALLRLSPQATKEQLERFDSAVREALARIPAVHGWAVGPALRLQDGGYDYALQIDFLDATAFSSYKAHPAHAVLIKDQFNAQVIETARIQFEI